MTHSSSHSEIHDSHAVRAEAGSELAPSGVPRHLKDFALAPVSPEQRLVLDRPDHYGIVDGTGGEVLAAWRECDRVDGVFVPLERGIALATAVHIPQLRAQTSPCLGPAWRGGGGGGGEGTLTVVSNEADASSNRWLGFLVPVPVGDHLIV